MEAVVDDPSKLIKDIEVEVENLKKFLSDFLNANIEKAYKNKEMALIDGMRDTLNKIESRIKGKEGRMFNAMTFMEVDE